MKTSAHIIANHRFLARLAAFVSVLFAAYFLVAVALSILKAFGIEVGHGVIATLTLLTAAPFVILSIFLMFAVTFILRRNWKALEDNRAVLALTWMVPYLGVTLFIGIPCLLAAVRERHPRSEP